MKSKRTILVVSLCCGLGASSLQAGVEKWSLSFLDTAGTEVGNGTFHYDTSTIDTFDPLPPPEFFGAPFDTVYGLDGFQSNLFGVELRAGGVGWWRDPAQGMGMLTGSRYSPTPRRWDGWFLGDPFEGVPGQVIMESDQTWSGYVVTPSFHEGSGTWIARRTAVYVGDLNRDRRIDFVDLAIIEHDIAAGKAAAWDATTYLTDSIGTVLGDVNGDQLFGPDDLIDVFAAGEYNDKIRGNSTYVEGDWNFDRDFDSDDLIEAFATGNYNRRRPTIVPEPASAWLAVWAGLTVAAASCRRLR